jgi:hypothetical protein
MDSKRDTGAAAAARIGTGARHGYGGNRAFAALAVALAAAAALAGCSIGVPDPAAPKAAPAAPTLATPVVTPGHDSAAVAARDMPFAAGDSLAAGVPVQLSDGLRETPGWKPGRQDVAGSSEYLKADGCVVSARVRANQGALAVTGDDRASTAALFQYLDSSILASYLKTDTLRWGGDPDKPAPRVEVLVLEGGAKSGARATAVYARLFGKAGTSVYISVSCPDAATLAAARADVAARLAVVPPAD